MKFKYKSFIGQLKNPLTNRCLVSKMLKIPSFFLSHKFIETANYNQYKIIFYMKLSVMFFFTIRLTHLIIRKSMPLEIFYHWDSCERRKLKKFIVIRLIVHVSCIGHAVKLSVSSQSRVSSNYVWACSYVPPVTRPSCFFRL